MFGHTVFPIVIGCRQEDDATISANNPYAIYAILGRPAPSAVAKKFVDLIECGHLPGFAPLHVSHIIVGAGNVIADLLKERISVIQIVLSVAILVFPSAIFVILGTIFGLLDCFSPSIVTAILLGRRGSYVAASPLCPRG